MLIAILDDGIDASFLKCPHKLRFDLIVQVDGTIRERKVDVEPILTEHGTNCAAIIQKYAPNADLCSLRIFHDESMRTEPRLLVSALDWCFRNKIPLVHLSVGSGLLSDYNEIQKIVSGMIAQEQLIIAAHSNSDPYSIPACLGGVFGVVADDTLTEDNYYYDESNVNFHSLKASSAHMLSFSSNEVILTQVTNSYAAPVITAILHNLCMLLPPLSWTVEGVNRILRGRKAPTHFVKPDFIKEAYLYNPHGYDILKEHLFFNCLGEIQITEDANENNIVFLAPVETYCDEELLLLLREQFNKIAALVYCGKLPLKCGLERHRGFLWSENILELYWQGFDSLIEEIATPVVSICGGGRASIDLLCQLRNLFFENEYQCLGISRQHFSYLYGLEYIPDEISDDFAISQLNKIYKPDIIILNTVFTTPHNYNDDMYYIVLQKDKAMQKEIRFKNVILFDTNSELIRSCSLLYSEILDYFL